MNQNHDKSLFEAPESDFKYHLTLPDNDRILFSGKFGSGKTSFLRHFFNSENTANQDRYEVFHLFPVNYSISTNEDILELIKYDIAIELLKKQLPVYDKDITDYVSFVKNHYDKVISLLLSAIPRLGKDHIDFDLEKIFKQLLELKKAFEEHKQSLNKSINEGDTLVEFFDTKEGKIGFLYEANLITRIIERVLKRHKDDNHENNSVNLENVLILDDLDRIDPEHIFRILNVFAAHFDTKNSTQVGSKNKFGFDRVIIVCDINNIRKIFAKKYGQTVDFSGYIDKFYSSEIFYYQSGSHLRSFIHNYLSKLILFESTGDNQLRRFLRTRTITLLNLLVTLAENDQFSIRKLINLPKIITINRQFNFENKSIEIDKDSGILLPIVLVKILGGYESTVASFQHLELMKIPLPTFIGFGHDLFRIHTRGIHGFNLPKGIELLDAYKGRPVKFDMNPDLDEGYVRYQAYEVSGFSEYGISLQFTNQDLYSYFFDVINFFKQIGFYQ